MVLLLAALPLVWVVWRARHATSEARRRALTLATLFLTFDLIVLGTFTRLTDSGLGCPDWPGCYGQASPLGAAHSIAQAQAQMPDGPVTVSKAWIEMVHRYLASTVGALILVLALWEWAQRRRARRTADWWPWMTVAWVALQGAFGAWTVTWKLQPAIVSLHLLGGVVLLALLSVQWQKLSAVVAHAAEVSLPKGATVFTLALLMLQVTLGAWVSTNYAVLACSDFPTCQGSWWPEMDFGHGFTLWRDLGVTADGAPLPFAALTAIHLTHRAGAVLVALALGMVVVRGWRSPATRRWSMVIGCLATVQIASGIANVLLGWPLLVALMHSAGAAALVVMLAVQLVPARVRVSQ